jgi:apolipoprotein N-acyltransferase
MAGTIAAGLLYTLACPPYEWSSAAWLVPGLLLISTRNLRWHRAALCGPLFVLVFGIGMNGWALHATLEYFDANRLAAGAFVGAMWMVYGGIPYGLLVAGYAASARRLPLAARGLAGAWLWVASEILRASLFTGLPWELLGHTQFQNLLLVQIADLGGVYAVSFLIALASVSSAELVGELRRSDARAGAVFRHLALPALALAATLAYGVHSRALYGDGVRGETRTVAVVQGNVPNAFRWKRAYFERALAVYAGLTEGTRRENPDLIVWPENAVNFYIEQEPMLHAELATTAGVAREGLLVGGPRLAENGQAHNSAYLLAPNGTIAATYDKQRLVPFAEYDPLPSLTTHPDAGSEPDAYTPGTHPEPLRIASLRIGTVICYEALFPHLVRDLVQKGADLLVNISNDAWLDRGDGAAPRQHISMVAFRAIETRRYLVRASASGVSGFFSPYGRPYSVVPSETAGAAVSSVTLLDGMTPYVRWGDRWFSVASLLAAAALARTRWKLA